MMKIVLASSEMSPVAKTGGLGDAMAALPAQLHLNGHDVCAILPYYRSVRKYHYWKVKPTGVTLDIPLGNRVEQAEILEYRKRGGFQIFFVGHDGFFDRDGLYGDGGGDFGDNAERFVFFNKAVVELCRRMDPLPDIVHANDWQTGLLPVFIRAQGLPFRTVLTIHNLAYQGNFRGVDFALTNLPGEYFSPSGVEFYGNLNLLKGGILHADSVTTVSQSYARDILKPEFGNGLDAVLRENRHKLKGFLNGADYAEWNPSTDKALEKTYRPSALSGKKNCREALLGQLGLDPSPKGPIYMMVTRVAEQKGFDILFPVIDRLLGDDVRLVILGEGDPGYESELTVASRQYPGKFAYIRQFDKKLAHRIQAGSDITLVPSRFEPCGLSVLYSLKYGTIPVAHDVGGLHEIVRDFDPDTKEGWGIVFYDYSPEAFWDAVVRARRLFGKGKTWKTIMRQAMQRNYSWEHCAAAYEAVYSQLLKA